MKIRKSGLLKGKISIPSDFDETTDEIIYLFYGNGDLKERTLGK